ncbi:hypothetical protein ACFY2T_20265 [Streptomyces sp. NPDC001260]|uniref:hypothetical protein n=1 Tax=Streptomyces sp. NPDC001260 TaxID=3364551 RepID=UPI0036C6BEA3
MRMQHDSMRQMEDRRRWLTEFDPVAWIEGDEIEDWSMMWDAFCSWQAARRKWLTDNHALSATTSKQKTYQEAMAFINAIDDWLDINVPEEHRDLTNIQVAT